ncbi:Olfactory receptor 10R2 [Manis javanica]|nr:Olfactory receptor 10R2 [Manis javanica]
MKATVVRIPLAAGRHKAFSTCAAHLTVVVVHFGCASIIYLRPESRGKPQQDRLVAVFYTVVTPLLNPVVYTAQQGVGSNMACSARWQPMEGATNRTQP